MRYIYIKLLEPIAKDSWIVGTNIETWNSCGQTYKSERKIGLGILEEIADWNIDYDFLVGTTDSIQIRPKLLHRNSKGIYYKSKKNGIIYLDSEEVNKAMIWADNFKDMYIEEN